jgi:iron complex outermembrane recepter protein
MPFVKRPGAGLTMALATLVTVAAVANAEPASTPDFTEFSLEALTNLQVISVSKRPERLNDAAAAIFVITADEIRRSGATSIPELLRMVPGLDVARIDANKWAVSARGFNGRFANKLLVLIDGRSVYEPAFSGVFWEVEGGALNDIERIEVIRGPGATLWGANAVNGVINIITRHSEQTVGAFTTAAAGTEERLLGTARIGGRLGDQGHFRVTGEVSRRDDTADAAGEPNQTQCDLWRAAGRGDWQLSATDALTVHADYVHEGGFTLYELGTLAPPYSRSLASNTRLQFASSQVAWQRQLGPDSQLELMAFYVNALMEDSLAVARRQTVDLELRHSFRAGDRHSLVWGGGYRSTGDHFSDGFVAFLPPTRQTGLLNAFAQDAITLSADRLRLILGSKLEHNTVAGTELQPNARLVWTPNDAHTTWAAVSRAIRTPSRYEQSLILDYTLAPGAPANPSPLPIVLRVQGDSDLPAEVLVAYEAGYRIIPTPNLSADLAVFFNSYRRLRSLRAGEPSLVGEGVPHVFVPSAMDDRAEAETRGIELALDWRAIPALRLHGAYAYYDEQRRLLSGDVTQNDIYLERTVPNHTASLRTSLDLRDDLEFDLWLKYTSAIPAMDVDAIANLDARIGWRCAQRCEFSLVGQNLLHPRVNEFRDTWLGSQQSWIERGIYAKVSLWF